jgi:hypothetical protein
MMMQSMRFSSKFSIAKERLHDFLGNRKLPVAEGEDDESLHRHAVGMPEETKKAASEWANVQERLRGLPEVHG